MGKVTDENIKKEWYNLHVKLVNEIISFCKEHNINASEVHLNADCLEPSIEEGEWTPYTDSGFILTKIDTEDDYKEKEVLISM